MATNDDNSLRCYAIEQYDNRTLIFAGCWNGKWWYVRIIQEDDHYTVERIENTGIKNVETVIDTQCILGYTRYTKRNRMDLIAGKFPGKWINEFIEQ